MKILVTGGNSFIGFNIVKTLQDKYSCIACYRKSKNLLNTLQKNNLTTVHLNLENSKNFKKLPKKIDIVIHAAAISSNTKNFASKIYKTNIIGSINLLQYAKKAGVKNFIFLSSMSAFGLIKTRIVNSKTTTNPQNLYGASKAIFEKLLENEQGTISSICLRLPGVVGKNNPKRAWLPKIYETLKKNKPVFIYNPNSKFNNILHVKDLANFIADLCKQNLKGFKSFPLASRKPLLVKNVIHQIKKICNSQSNIIIKKSSKQSFIISNKQAIRSGFRPKTVLRTLQKWLRPNEL